MYLLNTSTQRLQEFSGPEEVQYAILSHRWTEDEVTFEDVKDLSTCSKKGVSKVTSFCEKARELDYDWCWIDTCCINKASSAELSEAINSMFNWYQNSAVCIVYLQDVSSTGIDSKIFESEFRASTWFLRSWTLQELLATARKPTCYYGTNWQVLGDGKSLLSLVSDITTIDEAALLGQKPLSDYCIAERMSWASMRSATRIEDIAYSLLGIFDIQMPLVYGEGLKAFRRLQQAIMLVSDDETIFAWEPATSGDTNLLARSPSPFATSRYLQRAKPYETNRSTYELMSRGVKFDSAQSVRVNTNLNVLLLNIVQQKPDQRKYQLGIYLKGNRNQNGYHRVSGSHEDRLWRGVVGSNGEDKSVSKELDAEYRESGKSFYIPFDYDESTTVDFETSPRLTKVPSKVSYGYDLSALPPTMLQLAHSEERHGKEWLLNSEKGGPICNIVFQPSFQGVSTIHLGIDGVMGRPVYAMLTNSEDTSLGDDLTKKLEHSVRELTIDYSAVQPLERQLLPERTNEGKDWHIQIWPPLPIDQASWYHKKLWQHPKEQWDQNYFCPFPFDPRSKQSNSGRPVTSHVGWGVELLKIGTGKWKFGLVKYDIVSNWSFKLDKRLVSRILAARPQSLVDYTYSIDLDTFKSVKKFLMVNVSS